MNHGDVARAPARRARGGPSLVVVGASVRGFAQSAARCGWDVFAADLFADEDLRSVAREVVRVAGGGPRPYPAGLVEAIDGFPHAPWCFTGALENHPAIIEAIAAVRPLLGCGADVVRRVRDWRLLGPIVRAAGLSHPETRDDPLGLPVDGSFLVKPVASAGGRGIRRWTPAARAAFAARGAERREGFVWQRWTAGDAWSAALLFGDGRPRLLAAMRQLVGLRWCRAAPFAYCGSVLADVRARAAEPWAAFERLAGPVGDAFGLRGLVGVDAIVDRAGGVTVVEVNPRMTASMELLERATGASIAGLHLGACGVPGPAPAVMPPAGPGGWSKAVLFAKGAVPIDEERLEMLRGVASAWTADDGGWPAVADVPSCGQTIPSGAPLVTVFAPVRRTIDPRSILRRRVARVAAILSAGISPPCGAESSTPRLPPRRSTA